MEITYVALPPMEQQILPFYLAMEEQVARTLPARDYFFMWQVQPTVIFGRNQLAENEVNLDYCRSHGIGTYRRKSGGGCVYADMSNIMLSYITPDSNVNFTFNRYLLMVEQVLRKLGIDAKTTGRNDLLVDGRKVSGNAFYHLPGRSIVHGTMLYDTDVEQMMRAITPSHQKLQSKGVQSVRQHVATLSRYTTLSIGEFKKFLRTHLCSGSITLAAPQVEQIKQAMQQYLDPHFIYGHNPAGSLVRRRRIEGVGEIELHLTLRGGTIRQLNLMGDYFLVGDLDGGLLARLRNQPYDKEAVARALGDTKTEEYILNLTKENLINLLFNENGTE